MWVCIGTLSFSRLWTWFDRPGLLYQSLSPPRMRALLPVPAMVMGVVLCRRLVGGVTVLVLLGGRRLVGRALSGGLAPVADAAAEVSTGIISKTRPQTPNQTHRLII